MAYNAIFLSDITDPITSNLPLGPHKCAHVLRAAGFSCLVINHLSAWTIRELKEIFDHAITQETYLLGISNTFLREAIYDRYGLVVDVVARVPILAPQGRDFENEILSHARILHPNIKICLGGANTSADTSHSQVDYVMLGFSEISIINLMQHLSSGVPLRNHYKNIWKKNVIDDRKAEAYDFQRSTMAWLPEDVVNARMLPLEVARGCIFKCKFCSYPMNGKQQLDFVRLPELLEQELLENYRSYGITHYLLVDDTFNDHPEKLKSLQSVVKRLPFQPIFWAYHRLDLIYTRPETLEILHDIGIRGMYFGIETFNSHTGRIIGKGLDSIKQMHMIQQIKTRYPDISLHGSFIVGLPEESVESVTDTFESIINRSAPLDSWDFKELRIKRPGTLSFDSEITANPGKFGYEILQEVDSMPDLMDWRNQFMDRSTAVDLSNQFMSQSVQYDFFKVNAEFAIELSTYGLEFDQIRHTPTKLMDYHHVRTRIKPKFIAQYKRRLLETVIQNKALPKRPLVSA